MLNKKGFTLIELLVVIGIAATLISIAALSGRAAMDRNNVETLIKTMNASFLNARVSAMQRNRMFFVVLTPTQYTIYEDTDTPPNGNESLNPLDRIVSRTNIDPRYSLTIDAVAGQINFDTRGVATTGVGFNAIWTPVNLHVTASFGSSADCITVSTTRSRMGVWNAVGATCIAQ